MLLGISGKSRTSIIFVLFLHYILCFFTCQAQPVYPTAIHFSHQKGRRKEKNNPNQLKTRKQRSLSGKFGARSRIALLYLSTEVRTQQKIGIPIQFRLMKAHDMEILSAVEGAYDCDSESEGFFGDSVDDDELSYCSGDIPKLQFRKEASRARWIDELGMAEVVEIKGKMWTTTGIIRSGKLYCSIEETLFLVEIGALDVLNDERTPLSVSDMYRKIAEDRTRYGCSWESFEVYRHLKNLGYIVGRHGIPWSLKNVKPDATVEEGSEESELTRENASISSSLLAEKLCVLQLCATKPMYDVYPPNSKFKKSSPGSPCFVLYIISGRPPSKQDIENLEIRCGGNPLKFCIVEHGRVSFLSFTKVELPVLP